MRTLGNILWLIFGGLIAALVWCLVGLVAFFTIIGIPWGRACFVIAQLSLWPFGRDVISRKYVTGAGDLGTGGWGTLGNIIWFIFAGIWLAIGHLMAALCMFISIIGIPFGLQHLKLARLALAPIGMQVIDLP